MITVIMPSRGRPRQAREAFQSLLDTSLGHAEMLVVLDAMEDGYDGLPVLVIPNDGGMAGSLNKALPSAHGDIIGFIGDDHRFRTPGWDHLIEAANADLGGGVIYGNDLLRGEDLASAVFMDARIVRALGWMALPGARHLFLDDAWMALGQAMGRLRYLPDVIVEHMHPTAGKADWDDDYRRVNAPALYEHDAKFFHAWMDGPIADDVARVMAALR